MAPAILGIVLGAMLEENFIASMNKSEGSLATFFLGPIAATLAVMKILAWLWPVGRMLMRSKPRGITT